LLTAVGKGADGASGFWSVATYASQSWATSYDFGSGGSTSIDWSTLYSQILSHQSTVNAGGSGERTVSVPTYNFQILLSGQFNNLGDVYTFSSSTLIRGTGSIASIGSPPGSGTITYAQILNNTRGYYLSGLEYFSPGTTGAATTGFGLTFPGGVGAPASTTTFTSVAVTPGTTYTVVNNQSLVITYVA
jgi:hypothetical protein